MENKEVEKQFKLYRHVDGVVEEKLKHVKSAPETKDALKSMQREIKNLNRTMTENCKDIDYIKENIEEIKEYIKKADSKYANKSVEKLVYGLCGSILIAFIYALTELVFKK